MSPLILIIGASGFIGRNLVCELGDYDIVAVSRYGVPVAHKLGVTFTDFLKLHVPSDSILINCAAHPYDRADLYNTTDRFLTNIEIINSIYSFCVRNKVTEIRQFSSVAVYPAKESEFDDFGNLDLNQEPYPGEAMYAWSKRIAELYSRLFSNFGINTLTFRLTSPYGPHDSMEIEKAHVVPSLILRALRASGELIVSGNLEAKRDFIFVKDVCSIIKKSLEIRGKTDIYNLGSGTQTTIYNLALDILCLLEKNIPVVSTNEIHNPASVRKCKNFRLKRDFEIDKFTSLLDGLRTTLYWYRERLDVCSHS